MALADVDSDVVTIDDDGFTAMGEEFPLSPEWRLLRPVGSWQVGRVVVDDAE